MIRTGGEIYTGPEGNRMGEMGGMGRRAEKGLDGNRAPEVEFVSIYVCCGFKILIGNDL